MDGSAAHAEPVPSAYARRSLWSLWGTVLLGIAGGASLAIGLGAAFSRSGPDALAPAGIAMLVAAAALNLRSLASGVLAWRRDRVRCRWLYVNVVLLLATGAAAVMLLQL